MTTPNGNIASEDDPIAARNHAHEAARQEILREVSARVFKRMDFDPYAAGEFLSEPRDRKTLREKVTAEIDAECREAWKAAGLLP